MNLCSSSPIRTFVTAALVMMAGLASPAAAVDIAQTPIFLGASAKPNFILALDDSTSMFLERTYPGGDPPTLYWNPENNSPFITGQPGVLNTKYPDQDGGYPYWEQNSQVMFDRAIIGGKTLVIDSYAFARSADFNSFYFHRARTYLPWLKHDGSRWPDANPAAASMDPRDGKDFAPINTYVMDLTDAEGRVMRNVLSPGMVLTAGTTYAAPSNTYWTPSKDDPDIYVPLDPLSDCGVDIPPVVEDVFLGPTDAQWDTLDADVTIEVGDPDLDGSPNMCILWFRYFPATFYLKSQASLPDDYGYIKAPKEIPNAFGPPVSESLWRYEIRPENFVSAKHYDAAIRNFANYFEYHRNRFLATIAATTEALADVRNIRLGSFKINDLIDVQMKDMNVPMQRQSAYETLTSLQSTAVLQGDLTLPTSQTPNRDGVAHIGKQYQRKDSKAPIEMACQINAGMLFTDGYTTKGNGPATYGNADGALDAPFADSYDNTMADIVTSYFKGANTPLRDDFPLGQVPVPSSCKDNPEPWVDCETNLHMKFFSVALGPQGNIHGVDLAATADPFTNFPKWDAFGSPKITNGPVVIDELWHAALNGRGSFVNAKAPADVTAAIKNAVVESLTASSFTGGTAASSTRREEGFLSYVARYNVEDWTGDLTAHTTDTDGQFIQQVWSAAQKLEEIDPEERKVFFSDAGTSLKPFSVDALGGELGAIDRLELPASLYERTVAELVEYLRGDHTYELKNPAGNLRNRDKRIGDIFGSQPEVLTRSGFGYSGLPEKQGGGFTGPGSYGEFMETTKKNRTPVVFVGANDGMLHAFNAGSGPDGGKEIFAIIPHAVLNKLGELPDPAYQHRYYVDGSPVQGDAWDGSWKTILLTPMGAGGKSIMALDVTDPASGFGAEQFLWEFTDPDLNETLGKPHIVLLESGKWAAVFASGIRTSDSYNDMTQYVYFVDLFSGELIAKVGTAVTADESLDDGIVNLVPVDSDFDLKADTVYMADYDAYLWRIDISDDDKVVLGNAGAPLMRGVSKTGRPQWVTGGIESFPHHIRGQMVFFGTGRYLASSDNNFKTVENTFYAFWDDPQSPGTIPRSNLQEQDILAQENVQGLEVRRISDVPVNWLTKRGWALDLVLKDQQSDGERFIGDPIVALGRVIFPTFTPGSENPCVGGGVNRVYSLSATNGVGEYTLPGGEGTYGSIEIPPGKVGAGPILTPTLVASAPPSVCKPGDPECPLLVPDEEGSVKAAPSVGCRTALGVLLGDGLLNFDNLTCGRQSWQQVR